MAQFDEHISKAKQNLRFLEQINTLNESCYDWQVTVCFYTAVHLINAHMAKSSIFTLSHSKTLEIINPYSLSPVKIDEEEFTCYKALLNLSRRSRYLVHDKTLDNNTAHHTFDVHVVKAVKNLDCLLVYFQSKYGLNLSITKINCPAFVKDTNLTYIKKG